MSCGCSDTWTVPMRDTGIWNKSNTGRKQQTSEAYAKAARQPHPVRGGKTRGKIHSVHYTMLDGLDSTATGPEPPCSWWDALLCRCGKCAERRAARHLPRVGDPGFVGPLPPRDPHEEFSDPAERQRARDESRSTGVFVLLGLGAALWFATR